MVRGLFRYIFIVALLIVFGFGTRGFSNSLADAYNVLISYGWSVKDALGFLGASLAGTLALNPSVAPAVAAGALSAYIAAKGAQLYDIYREWKNLRTGIAMLNPVNVSGNMSVKQLRNGEYGWTNIMVYVRRGSGSYWDYGVGYFESYNDNGAIKVAPGSRTVTGYTTSDNVIASFNSFLSYASSNFRDPEGVSMLSSFIQAAYNNLLARNNYSVTYTRQVAPALEVNSSYDGTIGYSVNVDPNSISEEGLNYLSDPAAFYDWFISNYMNGTNQGVYVTPLDTAYDKIRSDLQAILNKLNNLSVSGGVSEDVLNQIKTEIINTVSSVNSTVENNILNSLDSKFTSLDSKLTSISDSVNSNVNSLRNDITSLSNSFDSKLTSISDSVNSNVNSLRNDITSLSNSLNSSVDTLLDDISEVKTSVDALTSEINESEEQQQGFWEGLLRWLDETLWEKMEDFWQKFLAGEWFKEWVIGLARVLFVVEEEKLNELIRIEVPEYEKNFGVDVSFSSYSVNIPISLFGTSVDLSRYIYDYAAPMRNFMNIFISGLAAVFVIRAFRVHFNID